MVALFFFPKYSTMNSEDYSFIDDGECHPGEVAGEKWLGPNESLLGQGRGVHYILVLNYCSS